MKSGLRRGWRCTVLSPRCKTGLCGALFGAGLSFALVAAPLLLLGGGSGIVSVTPIPLSALSTIPAESSQFDIAGLLVGDWVGEICPDEGEPVAVRFEFIHDQDDVVYYSLTTNGLVMSHGMSGSGACDVDGEDLVFHAFLAILSDCDEACGVDRAYEGHFDEGALVGR